MRPPEQPANASLNTVFETLGALIAERPASEPFMLTQLQSAIKSNFPTFSFAAYGLSSIKDFLAAGEKAGYFKLVNAISPQTARLLPGPKASAPQPTLIDNDPRRKRWMTTTMEALIMDERGNQLVEAIRSVESMALTPEFDAFLAAEGKASRVYPVRGKIKRVREFLRAYREQGEEKALAAWQVSRPVLQLPTVPPLPPPFPPQQTAAAQSLIWSLLQGNSDLATTPLDSIDNGFFAVLAFCRDQMAQDRAWDWVAGLELLEADARAIPHPVPETPTKRGLFGGNKPVSTPVPVNQLDEAEIQSLTAALRSAAGFKPDDTPRWQAFLDAPGLTDSYQVLEANPALTEDERLLVWLDDRLGQAVAANNDSDIKRLASKAAIVIAARQMGLREARQHSDEMRAIYQSVMDGAHVLSLLFTFLDAPTPEAAAQTFSQHAELADGDAIVPLLDDQTLKAVHAGDATRYRRVTERADLWRNLVDFGAEEGLRQHGKFNASRDDKAVQAEMGLTLLSEATNAYDQSEIIGQYPAVATKEGYALAEQTINMLSFQNAEQDVYNHYFAAMRLIGRCLEVGVDRALAELK